MSSRLLVPSRTCTSLHHGSSPALHAFTGSATNINCRLHTKSRLVVLVLFLPCDAVTPLSRLWQAQGPCQKEGGLCPKDERSDALIRCCAHMNGCVRLTLTIDIYIYIHTIFWKTPHHTGCTRRRMTEAKGQWPHAVCHLHHHANAHGHSHNLYTYMYMY